MSDIQPNTEHLADRHKDAPRGYTLDAAGELYKIARNHKDAFRKEIEPVISGKMFFMHEYIKLLNAVAKIEKGFEKGLKKLDKLRGKMRVENRTGGNKLAGLATIIEFNTRKKRHIVIAGSRGECLDYYFTDLLPEDEPNDEGYTSVAFRTLYSEDIAAGGYSIETEGLDGPKLLLDYIKEDMKTGDFTHIEIPVYNSSEIGFMTFGLESKGKKNET